MSDDFINHINPIVGSPQIDRLDENSAPARPPKQAQSISGRIISVKRSNRHGPGGKVLDLTVGGAETTEIVLRVPNEAYGHLEGKRAVLYIDE